MSEQTALKLQVKCTVKDIFRYNLWVAYKSLLNKGIACVGIGLIVYFFYGAMHTLETLDVFISQNLLVLLLGLFIFVGKPFKVWKITVMQMQTPALAKGTTYTFTQDKIFLTLGEKTEEVEWEVYTKIIETKKDFRFFVSDIQAQLIPKHSMDKEQLMKLKQMISKAMPQDRQVLRA